MHKLMASLIAHRDQQGEELSVPYSIHRWGPKRVDYRRLAIAFNRMQGDLQARWLAGSIPYVVVFEEIVCNSP
jgi:hypothetical protein